MACLREAAWLADSVLLEPVMSVEVTAPADAVGDVMGDVMRRRGSIASQASRGADAVVGALVPLANMFGYASHLRSATSGRATFAMYPAHYAEVPRAAGDAEVRAAG